MTEEDMVSRCNWLLEQWNRELHARINLVAYLNDRGMRLKDIYAIAEQPLGAKVAA